MQPAYPGSARRAAEWSARMTWVAPDVVRVEEPFIAGERTMLAGWLGFHRTILRSGGT